MCAGGEGEIRELSGARERAKRKGAMEHLAPHTPVEHHFSQVQTQTKSLFGMHFYGMAVIHTESWPYFACV